MAESLSQTLLSMKEKIEGAKEKRAQLKGELNELMRRLKQDYGITNIKQAEKKVKEMQAQIVEMDKEIEAGVAKLEKDYEW
jgi:predicted  nucleic acid-binding Zn-ribbon protein